jgi:hypothetical protein
MKDIVSRNDSGAERDQQWLSGNKGTSTELNWNNGILPRKLGFIRRICQLDPVMYRAVL